MTAWSIDGRQAVRAHPSPSRPTPRSSRGSSSRGANGQCRRHPMGRPASQQLRQGLSPCRARSQPRAPVRNPRPPPRRPDDHAPAQRRRLARDHSRASRRLEMVVTSSRASGGAIESMTQLNERLRTRTAPPPSTSMVPMSTRASCSWGRPTTDLRSRPTPRPAAPSARTSPQAARCARCSGRLRRRPPRARHPRDRRRLHVRHGKDGRALDRKRWISALTREGPALRP